MFQKIINRMSNWKFTTVLHEVRIKMGITPNEYTFLDLVYKNQTNPDFATDDGYTTISYSKISEFLGFSKGAIHKMVAKFVANQYMEIDEINTKKKRTTELWYKCAYLSDSEEVKKVNVQKVNVQKVNASVQKVNDNRSKSERNRSKSERKNIKEYNKEYKLEDTMSGKPDSAPISGFEKEIELRAEKIRKEKNCAKKEKIKAVVDYLNECADRQFKSEAKATQKHISARLDEGFTVEQFKRVIELKVFEWGKDPKMSEFIRPQTLFGTKMESYYNRYLALENNSELKNKLINGQNKQSGHSFDRRKQAIREAMWGGI